MLLSTVRRVCLGSLSRGYERAPGLRCVRPAGRSSGGAVLRGIPARIRSMGPTGSCLCAVTSDGQGGSRDSGKPPCSMLVTAAAFSLFSKLVDKENDEGLTPSEEKIVYLLKTAKLSIMKGEMEEAEEILHKTLHLAQECESKRAITYTYDLMANLAFLRGKYDSVSIDWITALAGQAEKLFKTTMVYMLDTGVEQDDNSFIEISLKLASIYAALNQNDLAVAGFQYCIMSLNEKITGEKDLPKEILTAEERTNTRLLLGLCLDSYARYLVANSQLMYAQIMYEKALQICREEQGELHPQTVNLLSDLASVVDAQGRYDEAYTFVNQALDLAQKMEHPDQHVILSNLAMILMHQGTDHSAEAERMFKEALTKAEEKKDFASIQSIQDGLSELARRKKNQD